MMTITLTDELEELINEKIKGGAYKSADEVIMASLRLLSAKEQGTEALRREILLGIEDIQQGRFMSCTSDSELEEFADIIVKQAEETRRRG